MPVPPPQPSPRGGGGHPPPPRRAALACCAAVALSPLAAAGAGWADWPLPREITGTWEVANPEAKHMLRGVSRVHLHADGTATLEQDGQKRTLRWSLLHSRLRLREPRPDRDEPGVVLSRRRRSDDYELTIRDWERKPGRLVLKTDFPRTGKDIVLLRVTPARPSD